MSIQKAKNMKPLKVAILWHQHQPYYEYENYLLLPWTRLHGIKDYADLPSLLFEYPNIKQTFNIVPSMALQIKQYYSNEVYDNIQALTNKKPSELSENDKKEIIRLFFLCNYENMIAPNRRYNELYHLSKNENSINLFTEQDWLDLQTWYNLAWFGPYSKEKPAIKRLFNKGNNFSEIDKKICLEQGNEVLESIFKIYSTLQELEQVEISFSPFYHPILPLLCDSDSALEAMPRLNAPNPNFSFPDDAKYQIQKGSAFIEEIFKKKALGLWPSEGSISNKTIELFVESGLNWFATDEGILHASGGIHNECDKYFPRKIKSAKGAIAGLFRDHALSDAIGFLYSKWNPNDAASDFVNKLREIKNRIIHHKGENALEHAVVPIILDGENCWEFYPDNGFHFLRALYSALSNPEFETVTCSEACSEAALHYLPPVEKIRAGSWIDSNFRIWIDGIKNKTAWEELAIARKAYEDSELEKNEKEKAYNELLIAEGSDWFWWYCDDHQVENKLDFDKIFRYRLRNVYKFLNLNAPARLHEPIGANIIENINIKPKEEILYKPSEKSFNWENAGVFHLKSDMTAMHKVGELAESINYGTDGNNLYLRINFKRELKSDDGIELEFQDANVRLYLKANEIHYNCAKEWRNSIEILIDNSLEIKVPKSILNMDNIRIILKTLSSSSSYEYTAFLEM